MKPLLFLINRTLAFKILAVNSTLKKITKRGKNDRPEEGSQPVAL